MKRVYTEPLLKTTMNSKEYDRMYQVEEELWWYKGLRDLLAYYLKKEPHRKLKILDVGCGTGMNMLFIESLGHTAYGVDVSSKAVMYAKKRKLSHVSLGSITKIPFGDETFDVVLGMDVIGLLSDKEVKIAIAEMYRVLKPNGVTFIHTAALEFLRSSHDKVSHVQRRYTMSRLGQLFNTKKWSIQKLSYRMFLLFLPLALVKLIKRSLRSSTLEGDLYLPHPLLNGILIHIQQLENLLLRYCSFPFGTSLFVIARKK